MHKNDNQIENIFNQITKIQNNSSVSFFQRGGDLKEAYETFKNDFKPVTEGDNFKALIGKLRPVTDILKNLDESMQIKYLFDGSNKEDLGLIKEFLSNDNEEITEKFKNLKLIIDENDDIQMKKSDFLKISEINTYRKLGLVIYSDSKNRYSLIYYGIKNTYGLILSIEEINKKTDFFEIKKYSGEDKFYIDDEYHVIKFPKSNLTYKYSDGALERKTLKEVINLDENTISKIKNYNSIAKKILKDESFDREQYVQLINDVGKYVVNEYNNYGNNDDEMFDDDDL